MIRKQRRKFAIAIYLCIGSLAIVLAVIGIAFVQGTMRNLILNLATDLLSVVLLFFIVNQFFGINTEEAVFDKVEEMLHQIELKQSVLVDSPEARQRFPTTDLLASARKINVLGYSLKSFLDEYRNLLVERVQAGAKVRILVIGRSSHAHQVIQDNSELDTFDKEIELSLDYAGKIEDCLSRQGNQVMVDFELRVMNWIPSCALIILDPDQEVGRMKLAVNSPYYKTHPKDRLYLVLSKQEQPSWFNYYSDQFERLWIEAKDWRKSKAK